MQAMHPHSDSSQVPEAASGDLRCVREDRSGAEGRQTVGSPAAGQGHPAQFSLRRLRNQKLHAVDPAGRAPRMKDTGEIRFECLGGNMEIPPLPGRYDEWRCTRCQGCFSIPVDEVPNACPSGCDGCSLCSGASSDVKEEYRVALVVGATLGKGRRARRDLCPRHQDMAQDYIEDMRRDLDEQSVGDPNEQRCPICGRPVQECRERGVETAQSIGPPLIKPKIGRWVHPSCVELWNAHQQKVLQ